MLGKFPESITFNHRTKVSESFPITLLIYKAHVLN